MSIKTPITTQRNRQEWEFYDADGNRIHHEAILAHINGSVTATDEAVDAWPKEIWVLYPDGSILSFSYNADSQILGPLDEFIANNSGFYTLAEAERERDIRQARSAMAKWCRENLDYVPEWFEGAVNYYLAVNNNSIYWAADRHTRPVSSEGYFRSQGDAIAFRDANLDHLKTVMGVK